MTITEITDQAGIVHLRVNGCAQSVCGQDARSWSAAVTAPMLAGLVVRCTDCDPFAGIPVPDDSPF